DLYRDVVRARTFDERAISLQRQGWMSSYPPFEGQEASQVGAAHAMAAADWLFPTYRSNAMQFARGVPMSDVLLFRRGYAEFASDHDVPVFPQAVPIATQIPHATGIGMAANYRDADHAVLCYFGDGATSEGDFHEGLNFAGVFEAPVVFFCENNGWAISMDERAQTASATIAQKADAYGFEGVRVDGNDPIAVFETVAEALETARSREPVLVESLTYRQGAHTTSDDPSRYRDEEDLPDWRTADPLERYEDYLRDQGVLDDRTIESIASEAEAEVDDAVEAAEATPEPDPEAVFDPVYAEGTPRLVEQADWLEAFADARDVRDLDR
ncbi:MAG: pyruvate dehydrogenase (acetyl-transferring) E1 component subunit alpha, partial [Haloarculaceae archaeon]